ncbi:MAG: glutathione S-transferase N-terminal domain-containing protein [Pseudomonadota bacterium]
MTHHLYAAPLSLFSGKARAYLTYKQVPVEEHFADRDVYRDIILPRIGYPVMPVTITDDDEAIQDTSALMDAFERRAPEPAVRPDGAVQNVVASLFELYGDEWLVIPAMHYRWVYNRDFALGEFGKIAAPGESVEMQRAAAEKTSAMFQQAVPLLGASAEMADAVETSYLGFLQDFDTHLARHDFLLGGRPCQGDFGLIGPLYAHLYRDPASGEMMKREAPRVAAWVERMIAKPFVADGAFVEGDDIPETLIPLLTRMMAEQGPCLLDLFEKLAAFKREKPDAPIPRMIGMHAFTMSGKTGSRMIIPYTQWMAQRALDLLVPMAPATRARVDAVMEACGGTALAGATIAAPVTLENHKIVWAN